MEVEYDPVSCSMAIDYNPSNAGGTRKRMKVMPWTGAHEFVVDEARAAGCQKWLVRVRLEWDAHAAVLNGKHAPLSIEYKLEDFDCRELLDAYKSK